MWVQGECTMFHVTERLLLRPAWPEDADAIFGGLADEVVVRNLARAPWPYSRKDARDFAGRAVEPMSPRFLVTRTRDAALIGCIGIETAEGEAELGYWIARPFWGQGYATEAGRAVVAIARSLGYGRLVADHFLDNPASGRVLQKLGFAPTGRVVERHSCGRNATAPTREFALDLVTCEITQQAAA